MKHKKILIKRFIFLTIFSLLIFSIQPIGAQGIKKIGIDLTPGRVKDIDNKWSQKLLRELEGNLTAAGWEVVELTSISPETLADLDALVIGKLYNEQSGFSAEEVQAIADWFKQGGKFLWVGADSDYTEPYLNPEDTSFKSKEPNKILGSIGSHIFIDHMSVVDPDNNAGASWRVIAAKEVGGINDQGVAAIITTGVERVLFHSPAGLVGLQNGEYVPVEQVFNEHIFWLCRTGPHGIVVSYDRVYPEAYEVGDTGRFYLAAAEMIPTSSGKYSKVVVTTESIIGDRNIFNSEYHGISLDGPTFVINVFRWGLKEEQLSFYLHIVSPFDISGEGLYRYGEEVTISVETPIYINNTVRYMFVGWGGDIKSPLNTITIVMDSDKTIYAKWKLQYYLNVTSEHGHVEGGGWYDKGAIAQVNVEPVVEGIFIKYYFKGWIGDITSDKKTLNILMDKPKTIIAEWEEDYTNLYLIITGGFLFVMGLAVGIKLKKA